MEWFLGLRIFFIGRTIILNQIHSCVRAMNVVSNLMVKCLSVSAGQLTN